MSLSKFRSLDAFLTITKKRRLEVEDDEGIEGESSEPVHIPRNGEVSNAERQPEHGDEHKTACSDRQSTDIGTLSDDDVRNVRTTYRAILKSCFYFPKLELDYTVVLLYFSFTTGRDKTCRQQ